MSVWLPETEPGTTAHRCSVCGRYFDTHKGLSLHDRAHSWRDHMKSRGLWPL